MRLLQLVSALSEAFWGRWQRFCLGEFGPQLLHARQIIEHASVDAIRPRVEAFLNNPARYEIRKSGLLPKDMEKVQILGTFLQEFFRQYEYVRPIFCDCEYMRAAIGPSMCAPGRIHVGTTTEHAELVVLPGEDVLFEVDGIDNSFEMSKSCPTIFHWLLLEEWVLTEDSSLLSGLETFQSLT